MNATTLNQLQRITTAQHKEQLSPETKTINVELERHNGEGGQVESVTQDIGIDYEPCNYGGLRYYLVCPKCDERNRVLYNLEGEPLCRKCTGLPYKSQLLDKETRLTYKLAETRRQLGWPAGTDHGPRPRGMWNSTYERMVEGHDNILRQLEDLKRSKAGM